MDKLTLSYHRLNVVTPFLTTVETRHTLDKTSTEAEKALKAVEKQDYEALIKLPHNIPPGSFGFQIMGYNDVTEHGSRKSLFDDGDFQPLSGIIYFDAMLNRFSKSGTDLCRLRPEILLPEEQPSREYFIENRRQGRLPHFASDIVFLENKKLVYPWRAEPATGQSFGLIKTV